MWIFVFKEWEEKKGICLFNIVIPSSLDKMRANAKDQLWIQPIIRYPAEVQMSFGSHLRASNETWKAEKWGVGLGAWGCWRLWCGLKQQLDLRSEESLDLPPAHQIRPLFLRDNQFDHISVTERRRVAFTREKKNPCENCIFFYTLAPANNPATATLRFPPMGPFVARFSLRAAAAAQPALAPFLSLSPATTLTGDEGPYWFH